MIRRRQLVGALALAPLAAPATRAWAQAYPSQPIRVVVGFAPGGGADVVARLMQPGLTKELGQPIIIDNKPGAGGNIAAQFVERAQPDGYTIMMGTIAALAINPAIYGSKLGFDPEKGLAPITNAVDSSNVLVVPASSKFTRVSELIEAAKSRELTCGISGIGTAGHLAGVMFASLTGTKLLQVPYKSGGQLMTALLGGEVDLAFSSGVTAVPQINAGKLRALAVTTERRTALLPDVQTLQEAGVAGFSSNNWYGLVAPAGTPAAIINRLNAACVKVLTDPETADKMRTQSFDPAPMTPQAFGAFMRQERTKWAKVVHDAGLKPEGMSP
jgi:tripartite-type tricarboxylate transporter receptor subunit TctC